MAEKLVKAIYDLSFRMRALRSMQQDENTDKLSDREEMILYLLIEKGAMPVSEIAAISPNVSFSTISTTITKLWREKKLVTKTISPESQRVTIVDINKKGREIVALLQSKQAQRFKTLVQAMDMTEQEKELLINFIHRAVSFFDKHIFHQNCNNKVEIKS